MENPTTTLQKANHNHSRFSQGKTVWTPEILDLANKMQAQIRVPLAEWNNQFKALETPKISARIKEVADAFLFARKNAERLVTATSAMKSVVLSRSPERINEKSVAEMVTRGVIDHLDRRRLDIEVKEIVALRIRHNEVYCLPEKTRCYSLTTKRHLLITALTNDYRSTQRLVLASGFADIKTVQQTFGDLKIKLRTTLDLDEDPIEGSPGRGYRLKARYRVIEER